MQMTFTLGDAIQLGATLGAIFLAYAGLRERLRVIEVSLAPILSWWNKRAARAADSDED